MTKYPGYRLDGRAPRQGGWAEVHLGVTTVEVESLPPGAEIALKRPKDLKNKEQNERLRREVSCLERLSPHPHVMSVLASRQTDHFWYVMPRARGSVADFARELTDREKCLTMVDAVSSGLEAAHAAGIIHRDVSPGNILALPDSSARRRWVVSDFGVARAPGLRHPALTRTGQALGTTGFSAPEMEQDPSHVTESADVFSLGVVAACALTDNWSNPEGAVEATRFAPGDAKGGWAEIVRLSTSRRVDERLATISSFRRTLGLARDELQGKGASFVEYHRHQQVQIGRVGRHFGPSGRAAEAWAADLLVKLEKALGPECGWRDARCGWSAGPHGRPSAQRSGGT